MFSTAEDAEELRSLLSHLSLLRKRPSVKDLQVVTTAPIFTMPILMHAEELPSEGDPRAFPQYGLLGGMTDMLRDEPLDQVRSSFTMREDPRIFFNTAAPSSTFICGSQGSGKSHTLSCLLENYLVPSEASTLLNPLAGLVFHYDTFISDHGGSPCEAAFLAPNKDIKVPVLCSPTNLQTIERALLLWPLQHSYRGKNVAIEALRIDDGDLNTKRMLDLMAVSQDDGPIPLYLHTVYRILREMRIEQQTTQGRFKYAEFKRRILNAGLSPAQLGPLTQRLETLESFMPISATQPQKAMGRRMASKCLGTDWTPKPGNLTIVDLSCPCVTPEAACSLFNICSSIFLEQHMSVGRVVALDEAHKFMNSSAEALAFTNTLLSTIRLQRHLGARIVISTQEPTISPALLDLCSVTIVHRFSLPEWLGTLRQHLAAAALDAPGQRKSSGNAETETDENISTENTTMNIFDNILRLRVGEALLSAPSAAVRLETVENGGMKMARLGGGYLKIRVRSRLTEDGGKSIMAS